VKKSDKNRASNRRWLWAGVVAVATLAIFGIKLLRSSPSGGLLIAEAGAEAPAPDLSTDASTPTSAPDTGTTSDPFPNVPEAQIEWVLRNQKPAMILFHSTNCKPCITMTALVQQVRVDFEEDIVFVDVVTNDSANAELVQRVQIRTIPTTVFIDRAGEGQGYIGVMPEEDLRAELAKLVSTE
jgi:thiol-disulfide isomerase/thioredoxin